MQASTPNGRCQTRQCFADWWTPGRLSAPSPRNPVMKSSTCPPSVHSLYRPPALAQWVISPRLRWLALLALCAAYIQGGLVKAFDLPGAIAEMAHFGLQPALP